jgi:hypothetical protein
MSGHATDAWTMDMTRLDPRGFLLVAVIAFYVVYFYALYLTVSVIR